MACNNNCDGCSGCSEKNYTVAEPSTSEQPSSGCSPCESKLTATLVEEGGESSATDNSSEVDEMNLVGSTNGRFAKFRSTAFGFIQIINGVASVVAGLPSAIASWWHDTPNDPATPAKEAPAHVIADENGNLHMIRGTASADAIELWDREKEMWVLTPISEFPYCYKGKLDKAKSIELIGLSTDGHKDTPVTNDSERKHVGLKGDGLVFVKNFSNGDPTKPLSVATTVPTPDDSSETVWVVAWTFENDYYMVELSSLIGACGSCDCSGGSVPEIGENGNWFIDGVDTGKPSRGMKGEDGEDGQDGEDGVDGTGSPGDDGADGTVVTIVDGYIHLDGVDTGILVDVTLAEVDVTTSTAEDADIFVATFDPAQVVNDVDTNLNMTSSVKAAAFTHADGTASVTMVSGGDYSRVEIEAVMVYQGTTDNIAPVLRLRRALSNVDESHTGYQSGAANGHTTSSNRINYTDEAPYNGAVYSFNAIAGATATGGATYSIAKVRIKAIRKVTVVTAVNGLTEPTP